MIESEMKKPPAFRRVILRCEIARMKNNAKKYYLRYMNGGNDLDCGHEMADFIRPDKADQARLYNETMEKLQDMDPECPEWERL